jgi:hypothetical protein
MEKAAQAGDLSAAIARLPDLESRFARLKAAMEEFADEEPSERQ